jgi:hypothetical protein
MPAEATDLDPELERKLAAHLFNDTWRLLELPDRTPEQVDEMIHCAHASRYHWGRVGAAVKLARGEWICSRVYAVLGHAEPALWHARRCLAILEASGSDGGVQDWDLPAAYEGLARAFAVAGNADASELWLKRSRAALADVSDAEDRETIEQDLGSI